MKQRGILIAMTGAGLLIGAPILCAQPAPADAKAPIDAIYESIIEIFAIGENQVFTMEYPGRVLDPSVYTFDTSSIYSILEKPQPVLEAEFRLSDAMLDPEGLVAGPNGKLLSVQYEQALNLLVPNLGALTDLTKDRQKLRDWLLTPVTAELGGQSVTLSRMALFEELNDKYVQAKAKWQDDKTSKLAEAQAKPEDKRDEALETYSRWLAHQAAVAEAGLEGLFADLVVRGYYHEVQTYLSLMDIASVAEQLERTKARMRASSMSALDETETIYPVQFQPVSWFHALSTDFLPQDLLLDPTFLRQQVLTLAQKLDDLNMQRALLVADQTGDPAQLQAKVDAAQKAYDDAQSAQVQAFSNATIAAAQIAFQVAAKSEGEGESGLSLGDLSKEVSDEDADKLNKSQPDGAGPLTAEQWQQLADLQTKTIAAQQELNSTSRALAQLQAAHAAAETTDAKSALLVIDGQIQQVQSQLNNLKAIISSEGGEGDSSALLASAMPPAGVWMDIVATFTSDEVSKSSSLKQSSEHTSWDVDLILGSASGSKDKSASDFASAFQEDASDLEIGFRVTKVTIDRGGWFNPGIIDETSGMYKAETGFNISHGPGGSAVDYTTDVLPAYPTAFIIAKDVTIKVTTKADVSDKVSHYLQKNSSVGGGFLCFSASHASSSTDQSQSYYASSSGKSVIIKIPGPQILGWVQEFIAEDKSSPYQPMPEGVLPPDVRADKAADEQADDNDNHALFAAAPAMAIEGDDAPEDGLTSPAVFAVGDPRLPHPFDLKSSKKANLWSQVTANQWVNMLPAGWKDKGQHFYSQVRARGPAAGVQTPGDLELEIAKGTLTSEGNGRYRITLPIVNSQGQHMCVFFDWSGKPKDACELVTFSYANPSDG